MGYFDFLPNIAYPNYEGGNVIAKNILTRAKILDSVREAQSAALEYTVRGGEKPETLAYRVYGRSDYHWLILLFNEIHDPFFSWPMDDDELSRHVDAAYTGKALFVDPTRMLNVERQQPFDRTKPHLERGDLIRQRNPSGAVIASGTVQEWNPTLYRLTVESTGGSFILQGEAALSTVISDRTLLLRDLETVTKEGITVSMPLARITDESKYALNRFENDVNEVISPLFSPSDVPSPLIDRYVLGRDESIPLGNDASGESLGTASVVTNIEHEAKINDGKRNIRMMRPEYIDLVLRDFRNIYR